MTQLVSIIIPCFNYAHFLSECLDSVIAQTWTEFECLVIDDGSTDDTRLIAEKYTARHNRIRYYYKENGGLSSARNYGLSIAKGDFIQFLDADDTIHHLKLEMQLSCFSNEIDIVISDYYPFENKYKTFLSRRYVSPFVNPSSCKYDIVRYWETRLSIPCHCFLFKRELLNRKFVLDFDESLPNHEDWVFWTKLLYTSNSIYNLKISLANYRIHDESMCHDELKMREGFISALHKIILFFSNVNDLKGADVGRERLKPYLTDIKFVSKFQKNSLRRLFYYLSPPIIGVIRNNLRKFV